MNAVSHSFSVGDFAQDQNGLIRNLIWLYLLLWLIEGGFRRWFLPGLASPLLLVRDPLVIVIYCLAVSNDLFPANGFIVWGAFLAFLSFINAMMLGHGNLYVATYGVRCDFLHVPLIFIMGKVLREKDLIAMAKVAVWIAIPYTALLVAQFYQPQDAWVNRGVGNSAEGAGFSGALDRFRPPGTFSFITGPSQLYPLFTACWFILLLRRKLPMWTMVASAGAILISIPISISRTLFLAVVIVAITGMGAMFTGGRMVKMLVQFTVVGVILFWLADQSTIFHDGMEAFTSRWETATTDQGGFQEAIMDRMLNTMFGSFAGIEGFGAGSGFSTNVGQQLVAQHLGFGGSEAEWGRLLFDNGLALGTVMVGYRIALTGVLILAAVSAWQRGSPDGLLFASSGALMILAGPWGQTTTLGFATIGGGLTLAASVSCQDSSKTRPGIIVDEGVQTAESHVLSRTV